MAYNESTDLPHHQMARRLLATFNAAYAALDQRDAATVPATAARGGGGGGAGRGGGRGAGRGAAVAAAAAAAAAGAALMTTEVSFPAKCADLLLKLGAMLPSDGRPGCDEAAATLRVVRDKLGGGGYLLSEDGDIGHDLACDVRALLAELNHALGGQNDLEESEGEVLMRHFETRHVTVLG